MFVNNKEKAYIFDKLQILLGTRVTNINRNHGDIWFEFADESGKCYILLMQTLFRLCTDEKILITDTDKYKASDSIDDDAFDWDVQGANIFDKWVISSKNNLLNSLIVKDVGINKFGDLQILFNNNITLTVYLEVTNDNECWRFFEKDCDEKLDLVVLGNCVKHDT